MFGVPVNVIVVLVPEHIVVVPAILAVGNGLMCTVNEPVPKMVGSSYLLF